MIKIDGETYVQITYDFIKYNNKKAIVNRALNLGA